MSINFDSSVSRWQCPWIYVIVTFSLCSCYILATFMLCPCYVSVTFSLCSCYVFIMSLLRSCYVLVTFSICSCYLSLRSCCVLVTFLLCSCNAFDMFLLLRYVTLCYVILCIYTELTTAKCYLFVKYFLLKLRSNVRFFTTLSRFKLPIIFLVLSPLSHTEHVDAWNTGGKTVMSSELSKQPNNAHPKWPKHLQRDSRSKSEEEHLRTVSNSLFCSSLSNVPTKIGRKSITVL